jgi:hypothetical protein
MKFIQNVHGAKIETSKVCLHATNDNGAKTLSQSGTHDLRNNITKNGYPLICTCVDLQVCGEKA